jgi:hypothetical protein
MRSQYKRHSIIIQSISNMHVRIIKRTLAKIKIILNAFKNTVKIKEINTKQ